MANRKPLVVSGSRVADLSDGDVLQAAGIIESTSGGFKFPDGTVQTTAAAAVGGLAVSKENVFSFTDFLPASGVPDPWIGSSHASGGIAGTTSFHDFNHNGCIQIQASSSANSGYIYRTGSAEILLGGGEITNFIFVPRTASAGLVGRFGFHDTTSTGSAPVDAAMFYLIGNGTDAVISGQCYSNSSMSTVSLGALPIDIFYHARITVNAAAASVTFEVFDMSGTLIWTGDITTNIPTASGRLTAHAAQFFHTTGSAGLALVVLDWMDFSFSGRQRGAL